MRLFRVFCGLAIMYLLTQSEVAVAACSSPAGTAGKIDFDSTNKVLTYCNGTSWVPTIQSALSSCTAAQTGEFQYANGLEEFCSGSVWYSMKGTTLTTCSAALLGSLKYDTSTNKLKFCDGTHWYDTSGSAPSSYLTITQNGGLYTNQCVAMSVTTYNSSGTATPDGSNINIPITSSGPVQIYSDGLCTNTTTTVGINGGWGWTNGTFYVMATGAGTANFSVSYTGYTSGSLSSVPTLDYTSSPFRWTGNGSNSNWTTGANWAGGSAPGWNDTAVFTTCTGTYCNPTINTHPYIGGLQIFAAFTGTITQTTGNSIDIGGPQGWVQNGGTFVGSGSSSDSVNINSGGSFYLNAGSFTAPAGGTLGVWGGNVTGKLVIASGATFNVNSASMVDHGTYLDLGGHTVNNLDLNAGADMTIASSFTANGNLTIGSYSINRFYGSSTMYVKGNLYIMNNGMGTNAGGGGSNIVLNGANQTIDSSGAYTGSPGGGYLPTLTISSTGTVTLIGTINLTGNFNYTSGTISAGTSVLNFMNNGYMNSATATFSGSTPTFNQIIVRCLPGGGSGWIENFSGNFNAASFTVTSSGTGPVTANFSGSTVNIGSGGLSVGSNSSANALTLSSSTVAVGGTASSLAGGVTLTNSTLTFSGANTLTNWVVNSSGTSASYLKFAAGVTQTLGAAGMTLSGTSSQNLSVTSTTGASWLITPSATTTLGPYLTVTNSNNTSSTNIMHSGANYSNGGGNTNWSFP